jgi:segregation and condensation protein B
MEAVIYAAEEPVTLLQLAALFGEEAVAELSAVEDARAELNESQAEGAEESAAEQLALDELGEPAADAAGDSPNTTADLESTDATAEAAGAVPLLEENVTEVAADPDAEKRAQRLRERQQREAVRAELTALMAEYDAGDRGMEIREIAGGYRVATKPEYHDAVRAFAKSLKPPMKLTLQALETLAVIAYKQPVTAPEVSEIRGVDSGGVMGSLISRKLVTTAGRKQVLGRPILYKTTKEFLLRFGLKDLAELPSMEEFEKMAGELQSLGDEPEGAPEQGLLPVAGDGAESDVDSETPALDEGRGAPVEGGGLEIPQEPELSVIVVEDMDAAEPGMQVVEGGAAQSDATLSDVVSGDAVDADTHASELTHGAPAVSRDEQGFDETDDSRDEKEEANHG